LIGRTENNTVLDPLVHGISATQRLCERRFVKDPTKKAVIFWPTYAY
jgi:hypothetical protein